MSEVLVTLGIIGVVVAITLMVLIYGHEQQVRETQLEKVKSVIANAYRLMAAQQDVTDFKSLQFWNCEDFACFQREHKDVFKVVLDASNNNFSLALLPEMYNAAYADVVAVSTYRDIVNSADIDILWKECEYAFITPDGFVMGLTALDYDTKDELYVIVDINNSARPNTVGQDLYVLRMKDWALTDETTDFLNDEDDSEDEEDKEDTPESKPEQPEVEEDDDSPTGADKDKKKKKKKPFKKKHKDHGFNQDWYDKNKDKKQHGHGWGTNNGKGNGAQNQNGNGHGNWAPNLDERPNGESSGDYSDFNPNDYKGQIGGSSNNESSVPDRDDDKDKDKNNNGNNGNGNGNDKDKDKDKDKNNNGNNGNGNGNGKDK